MDPSRLAFTPSIAGVWKFVDDGYVTASYSGTLASTFFGNAGLGANQLTGVVMTGWSYSGFDNTADTVVPVNVGILEQQPDGTLLLDTASYVPSPSTNGGGSVLVADFNGDGRDDVFLAAHNESPFLQQPSTVLLSNPQGTFTKVTLTDSVMAHDAGLYYQDGKPVVITASFAEDYENGRTNPTYQWNGSGFTITEGALRNSTGTSGMSVAVADFDGNGDLEMAIGDFDFGLGVPYSPSNKFKIAIYDWTGTDIAGTGPKAILTPYFEARSQYANTMGFGGELAQTHSFRTWVDDFNHDGRPDIVAGQSLWDPANNEWPTMLQMLQNNGNFSFTDVSDTLNAGFDMGLNEFDYNMQLVDIDGSGILSYLSAKQAPMDFDGQQWTARDDRQANFLLVNDGTGRMHMALHEEFVAIGDQVLQYAASIYNNAATLYVDANQATPKLHGYLTADGLLNFVAEIGAFRMTGNVAYTNTIVLVNVPVEIDLRVDFTDAITIADRNDSMLMRTFAGNDVIHDANANTSASIDAGLGLDTAVYSSARSAYTLGAAGEAHTVSRAGFADTLRNVERLQFADLKVALDLDAAAGVVAKTLGAVFGADFVQNESYAGIGLALMDGGMSAQTLMQLALNVRLGANAANHEEIVKLLYTNVVGIAPPQGDLDFFVNLLDTQAFTPATLGLMASNTWMNQDNIGFDALSVSGLEYL